MINRITLALRSLKEFVAESGALALIVLVVVLGFAVSVLRDLLMFGLGVLAYGLRGFSWREFLKTSWVTNWYDLTRSLLEGIFPSGIEQ